MTVLNQFLPLALSQVTIGYLIKNVNNQPGISEGQRSNQALARNVDRSGESLA